MAQNSSIEWTGATWNPITGCTRISPGCKNCYAVKMAHRLAAMRQQKYKGTTRNNGRVDWTGLINFDEDSLEQPRKWRTPRTIFVNSMSDILHENIPDSFILRVFDAMQRAPWHRYQVLTKRSERLLKLSEYLPWPPYVWMGVSVESTDYTFRIDDLRKTDAAVKFLSLEPLLGPLPKLKLEGLDWVIVGGESGPKARPIEGDWVRDIRDQCVAAKVPFFFKQWGGRNKKKGGRVLDGRTWDEMPALPSSEQITCSSG